MLLDRDGDGEISDGDAPAAGTPVFLDTTRCTRTDDEGRFDLGRVADPGIVWVRTDSSMKPTLPWQAIEPGATDLSFLVTAEEPDLPFSFVVASDTHMGIEDVPLADQAAAFQDAVDATQPTFMTVTGDMSGGSTDEQFENVESIVRSLGVPFVPVPGNHDWYDAGPAYEHHFGPPTYSFESGGFHFVVLDYWALVDRNDLQRQHDAFMDLDSTLSPEGEPTVILMHAPPRTDLRRDLEQRGVSYLFTGHIHGNRVLQHDGFVELTTEPLVMGGIDLTPGGYRIAVKADEHTLAIQHRSTLNRPLATIVSSMVRGDGSACEARITAEVQVPDSAALVAATVAGDETFDLEHRGGWVYQSDALSRLCTDESVPVELQVRSARDDEPLLSVSAEVGLVDPPSLGSLSWTQEGGGPTRGGGSEVTGSWPETTVWAAPAGGLVAGGGLSAAGGRVIVPVSDLADGLGGGVVALSSTNGARLWEARLGFRAVGTPAVANDRVLIVTNDGTLHCLAADTGEVLWTHELAPQAPPVERSLYSSPLVSDGVVYAGGIHEFAAIEIASGAVKWSVEADPDYADLASHASPALADGVVVVPFNRLKGLWAFDAQTGAVLWTLNGDVTEATQSTPIIANDTVFVLNELFSMSAIDLHTGRVRWRRSLSSEGFYWGYQAATTPAYGGGTLFVPTTGGEVVAVDAATGAVLWRYRDDGVGWLRTTHYQSRVPAFPSQPIWTEGHLWLAGADGTLRVLDASSGAELWTIDLETPLVATPIVQGDGAVVADYGGLVRRLHGQAAADSG